MSALVDSSPLPARAAVRALVEDLLGRSVALRDAPARPRHVGVVGVYVSDRLATTAVVVVDLPGAVRLGGALGMLPRGGVDDAVSGQRLTGMLRDNCYEVLNVLASVFNRPGAPHVRLYEMYGPEAALPGDVAALASAVGSRLDVVLGVAGYGDATLSVVVR